MRWSGVRHPKAYLRRSVVNGCRSRARWERLRRGRWSETEPSTEQAPDELFDVLASLPHRQRAAIVLKYFEHQFCLPTLFGGGCVAEGIDIAPITLEPAAAVAIPDDGNTHDP
jgi:hypothetical protein